MSYMSYMSHMSHTSYSSYFNLPVKLAILIINS
jgi:hypothetical protein